MTKQREFTLGDRIINRFDLYEIAVQEPVMEAKFIRALHQSRPRVLAEDFCGPAAVSRAWIALHPEHDAIATDRDIAPLDHARMRAIETLGPKADRLQLQHADVLEAGGRSDIVAALNFAVCELHTRKQLLTYLRHVIYRLDAGGIFIADLYGGADAMTIGIIEQTINTDDGELIYQWEQRSANPATGRVENAMHFRLPQGQQITDAFVYDWRLWSTPELREVMREAGFRSTEVHDSYGGAIDHDGNLYTAPISTDEAIIPPPQEPDQPYVHYVVGRV